MKVSFIIEQIDLGNIALPEFQRGYVWNREQVRGLMTSLYRRHPVGGLLIWSTAKDKAATRGNGPTPVGGSVELLLDGQQRVTTLYGIIRGRPPRFFEGNAEAFKGLYFNLLDESFEFYAPAKMQNNPVWLDVTKAMQTSIPGTLLKSATGDFPDTFDQWDAIDRISRLRGILDVDFHAEYIAGAEMTIDTVVDIFNRVNSGGTKLSKGDLALATICAAWPEARGELRQRLETWSSHGYDFRLDWFLRCITTVTSGEALFSSLAKVSTDEFKQGVKDAEKYVNFVLNVIAGRLGLDHGDVLGSTYSIPLLARYLGLQGGKLSSQLELDKMLYWYVHTMLWGRYSGSTESVLAQDLNLLVAQGDPLDNIIDQLRQSRGDLTVRPDNFRTSTRGSRFYPLLYMLTRVYGAKDLDSGVGLSKTSLGHMSKLQVHHIFPKAKLYKHNYPQNQVNAVANFMFLTQGTNLAVSDRDPYEYLPHYEAKYPGVLKSQWIPTDPALWRYDRYLDFLEERRRLLADASNRFLNSLLGATAKQDNPVEIQHQPVLPPRVASIEPEEEERRLFGINLWMRAQGLPAGQQYLELTSDDGATILGIIDLAWPDGIQEGLTQPVALLLNEEESMEQVVNAAGYRFFTSESAFMRYVTETFIEPAEAAD
jgi:hypothetical protein